MPYRLILAVAFAVLALWPQTALAQTGRPPGFPPPVLVAQTPEFAAVRARWEGKTAAEVAAAGYRVEPACVRASDIGLPAALGNMGFHAIQPRLLAAQFPENRWDPQAPPVLLLDAGKRVVGLEWEGRNTGQPPVLFGQTAPLLPGHPGPPELNVPHYMLHAYFRPGGMVLFDVFDTELRCPAPASAPAQLPGTQTQTGGGAPSALVGAGLLGAGLVAIGAALRQRRRQV